MKLVIIAGGKGSRLGNLDIPKPMIPINGKPILEYQIELAVRYGISDIYILSGFKSEVIIDYFKNGEKWGITIHHIIESEPLGTSGAIKQLENQLGNRFMVFYGDTIMDINLSEMIRFDISEDSIGTLLVHPNDHPFDSDLIEENENHAIIQFHSKPHDDTIYKSNLVNAALYILSDKIFKYIPKSTKSDFGKDIFPQIIKDGFKLRAYRTPEYIKDMGTPERLIKITNDILSGKVNRLNISNKRKAFFLDRDGVINKEVNNLYLIDDFELLNNVSEAIKAINLSEFLCIVITNQPVIAKGFCTIEELNLIHKKMEHLLGLNGAYIDALYYCPHHPQKGFKGEIPEYKKECICRKPNTGMIQQAIKDFNIDIENSYFIGDSTTDLQTAKNAGIESILVHTGHAGIDNKFSCIPNYEFNNLKEAITGIINLNQNEKINDILLNIISLKEKKEKVIITVGGLSRSGKTTIVNFLNKKLLDRKYTVQVISLDNWILPIEKRSDIMTVKDRYQYNSIITDLNMLLNGEIIQKKTYDQYTRKTSLETKEILISEVEILFIEGTVALDIPYLNKISNLKIYVETEEKIRNERFLNFYLKKGLTIEKIEALMNERNKDEVPFINKSKLNSNLIINYI